ncbi:hypothetical protein AKJ41_05395 [candidate division MSBL1 archaeon SCGC-AAA259O05]|uniref:Uncharacterized protein n=1 Tax=candidate division MSBL1 archaeon SCGC-AAA259O05 TaxID=1698271 RepID=A0A133UZ60_9EURY|nr:hypothetical protein AKJ41_05395 [candidate division MSBL1 archaeon SCGC-AAA259O05]
MNQNIYYHLIKNFHKKVLEIFNFFFLFLLLRDIETFDKEEAKRILSKIEFHYTIVFLTSSG